MAVFYKILEFFSILEMADLRAAILENCRRALSTWYAMLPKHQANVTNVPVLVEKVKNMFHKIEGIAPYLEGEIEYEDRRTNPDPLILLNKDYHLLDDTFNKLLYQDLLFGPPDKLVAYLRENPEYIFSLRFEKYDSNSLLTMARYNTPLVLGMADIIREIANNSKEAQTNLSDIFEKSLNEEGLNPAEEWAETSKLWGDPRLDYLKALIAVSPSGERILYFSGRSSHKITELITDVYVWPQEDIDAFDAVDEDEEDSSYEQILSYEQYRQQQIANGLPVQSAVAERMGYVVPILERINVPWHMIFTWDVIRNIANNLILYIDSPYLAQWLTHASVRERLFSYMTDEKPEDLPMLKDYLLQNENQSVRDIVCGITDEESLVRGVLGVVDQNTELLRR